MLVLQTLLSLIYTPQRPAWLQHRTLRRHPSPPGTPRRPAHPHNARVSAYADDLIGFLRNTLQLPSFQWIIATFEAGSGALMHCTKTFLYCIGDPGAGADNSPSPVPIPTDIPFNTDAIRTLGIYVGTNDQITKA